jgi:two-component system chemotaxis sensor kinase CheA
VNLDELAAIIVGLDLHDRCQLERVFEILGGMIQDASLPEKSRGLAQEMQSHVGQALACQLSDGDRLLTALEQSVAALQQHAENLPELEPASESGKEESIFEGDSEILTEFIDESLEHLQIVETNLLALEKDPQDKEKLDATFRAFHSTKGTASFLRLDDIKRLAHYSEMLLDRARKGLIEITVTHADLALESADMLRQMILGLKNFIPGQRQPAPDRLEDLIQRLGASDDEPAPVSKPRPVPEPVMSMSASAGALTPAGPGNNNHDFRDEGENQHAGDSGSDTVRVSVKRLDSLINMVGELVVSHTMISQNKYILAEKDQVLSRDVSQMSKIARQLQDLTMSLRMVPLKKTFQKMERLVRDLSRKSGKPVRIICEGEDTEIDRNMVEFLSDPLVHMIRNALDHGIEPLERRRALGKPETGTFTLRAYHAAGNVVLELRDDGQGLNREKIVHKAIEKGLIATDKDMSENDIYKLVFLPGFSTAEKVTEVSGRGVGLDVVKKNIDALRGRIEISTIPGQETLFTIRIPLTLAIIDGMLLKVGDRHFILPTLSVQKAFRPTRESLSTVEAKGEMVRLRERLLPIFRLHRLFNIPGALEDPTQALLVVAEDEGDYCALLVDALLGQRQVVIRSMPGGLGSTLGISGAAILGDGCIGLILDVSSLMLLARGHGKNAGGNG